MVRKKPHRTAPLDLEISGYVDEQGRWLEGTVIVTAGEFENHLITSAKLNQVDFANRQLELMLLLGYSESYPEQTPTLSYASATMAHFPVRPFCQRDKGAVWD